VLSITIWMNMPSFYQGDVFRALVNTGAVELHVVYARGITSDRQELGWSNDVGGYDSTFLSRRWGIFDALRLACVRRGDMHIVNGLWAEPAFAGALVVLALQGSAYTIYSEAANPQASRGIAQTVARNALGRILGARARGWFPISKFAVEFYRGFGVRDEQMYPFGYFRAGPVTTHSIGRDADEPKHVTMIYVGQVIERKGVDLLLAALGDLRSEFPDVALTVIGDGSMRGACEQQAEALGIRDRVVFEGVLPTEAIPERLARADVLVLPSRWDGWGLVVNEALVAGVPVIVSDRCGASEVVENGVNGYVFRSGDVHDLCACLRAFLTQRRSWQQMRHAAREVGQTLTAEAVAPYFVACMEHMLTSEGARPVPPWLEVRNRSAAIS
jgi:glycosyltransferase involved in cell wall biosynthesis